MKEVHFGVMRGEFFEKNGILKFKLFSIVGEGGDIMRVTVSACTVLELSEECLFLKSGWRTYKFTFSKFTPGLNKVKLDVRLFGKIPFYRFSGEIGETYKKQFIYMFGTDS